MERLGRPLEDTLRLHHHLPDTLTGPAHYLHQRTGGTRRRNPADLDTDAVRGLARQLHHTYLSRGHGRALAVTGEEPGLSATVGAAVRAFWQAPTRRPQQQQLPAWWTVPAGIEMATRTALLTVPSPELAKVLPFPERQR